MMRAWLSMLLIALPLAAGAVTLDTPLPDAGMEQRAQALFEEMRCVVCEGQPLAESDARHAVDMRTTIRQMIARGDADSQIHDFFQSRYGDEVFMRPPTRGTSLPLWLAPFIMLGIGISLFLAARGRKEKK